MAPRTVTCLSSDHNRVSSATEGDSHVMSEANGLAHVATFCGQCNCGCPELLLDHDAPVDKRVVITDDFGQRIQMSVEQLRVLVADVKGGVLDEVLAMSAASST
jgi:hypothetical protein